MRRVAGSKNAAQEVADPLAAAAALSKGAPLPGRRVTILGSHATDGVSMRRFTELLERAYQDSGADVTVRRPPAALSNRFRHGAARKWVGYVEKFLIFPITARSTVRKSELVHVSDHSNAHWLLWRHIRGTTVVTCHDLFAVRAARGELAEHKAGWTGRAYQRLVEAGMRLIPRCLDLAQKPRRDALIAECELARIQVELAADDPARAVASLKQAMTMRGALPPVTKALLRLDPEYDALRARPDFQELL